MNLDQFREYCLGKQAVTEETPFDEHILTYKVVGKIFAITNMNGFDRISLKVEPEMGVELRERFPSVQPAYHLNKKHWIMVMMDGKVPDSLIQKWVDDSFNLVASKLTKSQRLVLGLL